MDDGSTSESVLSRRQILAGAGALAAGVGFGKVLPNTTSKILAGATAPARDLATRELAVLPRTSGGGLMSGALTQQIPASLNPLTNNATTAAWNSAPAHDWLEYYDSHNNLYPSLAESVVQIDGTHIRYVLRSGVKFQNGEPVTAQAVADLFSWIQGKKNGAWIQPQLAGVTTKVLNDTTFVLTLPNPSYIFRPTMARIPIIPVSTAGQQALHPLGCGPYIFEEWVQGSYVQYRKDPANWRAPSITVDSLRISYFPTDIGGTESFLAGGPNWCFPAALEEAVSLRSGAAAGHYTFDGLEQGVSYLSLNNKVGPFKDPRVRKAVRLCLNREQMVQGAFNGVGHPYFAFISSGDPAFPKDLLYQPNLNEARSLMKSAGLENGFSDQIYAPNVNYFQSLATIIAASVAQIGIDLSIQIEDTPSVITRGLVTHDFHALVLADAIEPSIATLLNYYVLSTGPRNLGFYSSHIVDSLLAKAAAQKNPAKAIASYQAAMYQAFIVDTGIIPLTSEALIAVFRRCNFSPQVAAGGGIAYWRWQDAQLRAS